MWSLAFMKDAVERAIRTACQVAAATIGTNQVGVTDLDWAGIASVAATAAVLSLLTSIGTSSATGQPNASMVTIETK